MKTKRPFSIESKIFLSSSKPTACALLAVAIFLLLPGCVYPPQGAYPRAKNPMMTSSSERDSADMSNSSSLSPRSQTLRNAPWDNLIAIRVRDSRLLSARQMEEAGLFEDAVRRYLALEQEYGLDSLVGESAFFSRLSILLKLGKGEEVLTQASSFTDITKKTPEQSDPLFAYLIAFAYLSQNDIDQTLAWFSLALRKARPQSPMSASARSQIESLTGSMSNKRLESALHLWQSDLTIEPIISAEQRQRQYGKRPMRYLYSHWFSPENYRMQVGQTGENLSSEPFASQVAPFSGEATLGVLLPLSGEYARYGERVRHGIELAVSEQPEEQQLKLVFADTQGEADVAVGEYQRLVKEEGVQLVLGPLLYLTSQAVGEQSQQDGVPMISFSKREGIPDIASSVFRLGATSKDQVETLVSYAVQELGMRQFAIFYPLKTQGTKAADDFIEAVEKLGARVTLAMDYETFDEKNLEQFRESIAQGLPDGIFIPDVVGNVLPLLKAIHDLKLEKTRLLGLAYWDDQVALKGFERLLKGAHYATPFLRL